MEKTVQLAHLTSLRRSTSLRICTGKTPGFESESGNSTQDSTSSLSYEENFTWFPV
jgi:hypothetical protein